MADHSKIEWTEATWNPIAGCSVVSPGCTNCYAMRRVAPRLAANPATPHYAGTVQRSKGGYVWTGKIGIASDKVLTAPLRWKRPRMIFANSTSDLFHEDVPDEVRDRIFAVMALTPQHTYQVLTKRADRMRAYLSKARAHPVAIEALEITLLEHVANPKSLVGSGCVIQGDFPHLKVWPLPNVWLGVSAEDQKRADERVPELLATPAAVRFVSAEPLLGPIDFRALPKMLRCGTLEVDALSGMETMTPLTPDPCRGSRLDWIIVGGESGDGARPIHPDWARSIRDQCADAGVAFFFKQYGSWAPHKPQAGGDLGGDIRSGRVTIVHANGMTDVEVAQATGGRSTMPRSTYMINVGKKAAGRLLDGVEHNGFPEVRT